MFRAWHRAATAALTVGAAIAAQLAAIVPAQAATPTITIAATSKINPVPGYVLVEYRAGTDASARIHGTITGATAGEVATLYAQPFPYTKAPAAVSSSTLSGAGTVAYAFRVTPTLATRYKVGLFARKTATSPLATSPTQIVYVAVGGTNTGTKPCGRPVCRETLRVYSIVPGSAIQVEMSKPAYFYFGLVLGTGGTPAPPELLYLNAGHPSFTAAQQISADEFERTLTFSFTIGNHSYRYATLICWQDTLAEDGLGLPGHQPGHHGCGSSRVPRTAAYLG